MSKDDTTIPDTMPITRAQYAHLSWLIKRPVSIGAQLGPDGQIVDPRYVGIVTSCWLSADGNPQFGVAFEDEPIAIYPIEQLTVVDIGLELEEVLQPVRDVVNTPPP